MKKTMQLTALALSAAFALTACGSPAAPAAGSEAAAPAASPTAAPEQPAAAQPAGTVLLSVNPEIEMDFDEAGHVLALEGRNGDGRAVLAGYKGYEGRPCGEVAGELVGQINAGGYFDETIGGQEKAIVLRLEPGSNAPAALMDDMAAAVRTAVDAQQIGSQTMTLDDDDLDPAYAEQGYISAAAAEQLLASQLGRDDVQFVEREYDLEDGEYEIAFVAGGVEYEFEVDARTGKVTEMDAEGRERWDGHWDDLDDLHDDDHGEWDDVGENRSDDWDDDHDDDWDDRYDDDWDDQYDDDWDDQYDDDWDDQYDDWDDQYDDWDDDDDDDWDDQYDDDWDDDDDDDWDDDDDDDWDDDDD